MTDSEKLILVFYVDVSDIDGCDVIDYMYHFTKSVQFDDSVRTIFIPSKHIEHTSVEAINPKFVSQEEYEATIQRLNETLEKIEKEYGCNSDERNRMETSNECR